MPIRLSAAAVATAGILATAGPAVAAKIAPQAADGTLGVAHMSAVVQGNGELIRGSGAVSADLINSGTYEVIFARPVRDCTYSATAGSVGTGIFSGFRMPVVESRGTDENGVVVRLFNNDGETSTSSFHLLVFCAQ